jgi:DNA polymerase-3 subunit epsilon
MEQLNFTAIDLETATSQRSSICEIGIAVVENTQIVFTKSWYVQPPYNEYNNFNIQIHGITPKDTEDSPTFPEVWREVEPYFKDKTIIAHNASFDIYALLDAFKIYKMDIPNFEYFCSYRLAKKVVISSSYSLPIICNTLGIDFGRHHRAAGDAIGCARVFLKCFKKVHATSLIEIQTTLSFSCGQMLNGTFRPLRTVRKSSKRL